MDMLDMHHWRNKVASDGVPAYSIFTEAIEKPESDTRDYRIIQLENGLQATIVSDPCADKAAASLDVSVGHLSDPDDMPGLAHFCEHMLFLGTDIFPKENEYKEFLSKNGGASNAGTASSNTCYHFRVNVTALQGALERFAAFFHCPRFAPDCTRREISAVDSEYKKNLQNDDRREFMLGKYLSREGHPWRKFGTGNRETLEKTATTDVGEASVELDADGGPVGRETRRRLVEWWTKEYCATRMKLCVIGKESPDEMSDLIATLFSSIVNRQAEPPLFIEEHPYDHEETGVLISMCTVKEMRTLELTWPLPDLWRYPGWRHKSFSYISHFLGHEGPGSLTSYLKKTGWITDLTSGARPLARGFGLMRVRMQLTKEGFVKFRDVMLAAFKYLSLLRASPVEHWVQQEISLLSQTKFRFREKKSQVNDAATEIAKHMAWNVPRELVLSAPAIDYEWEEGDAEGKRMVREMLEGMTARRCRANLLGRKIEHENRAGSELVWDNEPIYETEFQVERFDESFIAAAQEQNDLAELILPAPNKFIPKSLHVDKHEVAEPLGRPYIARDSPSCTVWHKRDDQFWVPKAQIILQITSMVPAASPRATVMTRIYTDLLKDFVSEMAYDAELAGLNYSISSWTHGIFLSFSGYNEKIALLVAMVVRSMHELEFMEERVGVMKDKIRRVWKNLSLAEPARVSERYVRSDILSQNWNLEEKLAVLDDITSDELKSYVHQLLSEVRLKALVVGNMSKEDANTMVASAERILASSPSSIEMFEHCRLLPSSSNLIWRASTANPREPNSSLTYYIHFGPMMDAPLRVRAALLMDILAEPAFSTLRTKEQLGYIVWCSLWILDGAAECGARITVQGEHNPAYLEARVDAFLRSMEKKIHEMPAEEFEERKCGLERKWKEKPKNMREEIERYWSQIKTGHLDFFRREHNIELLQKIQKAEILEFFMERVHPDSQQRSKLSIHLCSHAEATEDGPSRVESSNAVFIEDIVSFKSKLRPSVDPRLDVDWTVSKL